MGKYYMSIYDYTGKFIRKFEAPHNMDFDINYWDEKPMIFCCVLFLYHFIT